jgi:shikimate kinase
METPSYAEPADHLALHKPVVLIGLMGSGKSSIGARLAKTLGVTFHDTDLVIENQVCCSISDLFYYAGESYFRTLEKRVMGELLSGSPCVIARGGGTSIDPDEFELIKSRSTSIWIRAGLHVLMKRVNHTRNRPHLLEGDKEEILNEFIDARYPIYANADFTVDSSDGPHHAIVKDIIKLMREKS